MVLRRILPYFLAGALGAAACTDQTQEDTTLLKHTVTMTDNNGIAVVEGHTIHVSDEQQHPLEGIAIHHLQRNEDYLSLAVDPQGNYFPERRGSVIAAKSLRAEGYLDEILFVLEKADEAQIIEPYTAPGRTLLEESTAVNKYCLSLEYMESAYIDAPIGIIALLGTLAGRDLEEIKNKLTTKLKSIFEQHIVTKYGRYEGYEAWVPKTAISLCGEEYDGIVCPVTSEALARQIWSADLPIWEIRGACSPEQQRNNPAAGNRDIGNSSSQASCDLPACVQYGVHRCEEPCLFIQASASCIPPCQTDNDCQLYNGYLMKCFDLSVFNQEGKRGCFVTRCHYDPTVCPTEFPCTSLAGKEQMQTASGAEPFGALMDQYSCFNPNCL